MWKVLITGILALSIAVLGAISNEDAVAIYSQAVKRFDAAQYSQAETALRSLIIELGSTNIRIQQLLIKSLNPQKKYYELVREADIFFGLKPDQNSVAYQEIREMVDKAKKNVQAESKAYREATEPPNLARLRSFIATYDWSPNRQKAYNMQVMLEFDTAFANRDVPKLKEFVKTYPKSSQYARADSLLNYLEFNAAFANRDVPKLKEFLKTYPKSSHYARADSLLSYLEFNDAYNSRKIDKLKYFTSTYPKSVYYARADSLLNYLEFNDAFGSRREDRLSYFTKTYPRSAYFTRADSLLNYLMYTREYNANRKNLEYAQQKYGKILAPRLAYGAATLGFLAVGWACYAKAGGYEDTEENEEKISQWNLYGAYGLGAALLSGTMFFSNVYGKRKGYLASAGREVKKYKDKETEIKRKYKMAFDLYHQRLLFSVEF